MIFLIKLSIQISRFFLSILKQCFPTHAEILKLEIFQYRPKNTFNWKFAFSLYYHNILHYIFSPYLRLTRVIVAIVVIVSFALRISEWNILPEFVRWQGKHRISDVPKWKCWPPSTEISIATITDNSINNKDNEYKNMSVESFSDQFIVFWVKLAIFAGQSLHF